MATQHPPPPPSSLLPTIIPASLSSLAIYNPSLGPTDETLLDQLVFYTSRLGSAVTTNEKLRQIGLAQGIAEFARGFSNVDNCTSVETQKARVVTLELEPGWWIHAQIELTAVYNPTVQPATTDFTSREVAPPQLLVAELKKAYRQFCFHYGTLASNWEHMERPLFVRRLEKFWLRWAWVRWDVMLHGNPLVDMLAEKGIKMAGGRQGKEVGKQEREFMEGWVKKEKPRGVVDMVVSRFGEEEAGGAPSGDVPGSKTPTPKTGWFWPSPHLGGSKETKKPVEDLPPVLMPTDGCVFRGIGVLETKDVANYLTELYEKGDDSYTVTSSGVRRKKKKKRPTEFNTGTGLSSGESSPRRSTSTIRHARAGPDLRPGSTLAIRGSESQPLERLESPLEEPLANSDAPVEEPSANSDTSVAGSASGETSSHKPRSLSIANGKFLNMLTFGWGDRIQQQLSHRGSAVPSDAEDSSAIDDTPEAPPEPAAAVPPIESLPEPEETGKKRGVFLVGYQGDLDIEDIDDDFENSDGRITSRTVWLSRTLKIEDEGQSSTAEPDIPDPERTAKPPALEEFKLVVYTNKPFIFAILFAPSSRALSSPSYYRSVHHQLSPLFQTLLPSSPRQTAPKPPFDLLFLPPQCSVYSTLPPIPHAGKEVAGWTRADALHVYSIILSMMLEKGDREKSIRSMRGWWVNWMKLEGGRGEGFIIRRSGESGKGQKGEVEGPAREPDVKKYFEGVME